MSAGRLRSGRPRWWPGRRVGGADLSPGPACEFWPRASARAAARGPGLAGGRPPRRWQDYSLRPVGFFSEELLKYSVPREQNARKHTTKNHVRRPPGLMPRHPKYARVSFPRTVTFLLGQPQPTERAEPPRACSGTPVVGLQSSCHEACVWRPPRAAPLWSRRCVCGSTWRGAVSRGQP